MASNLGSRPISSKHLRPSSRPQGLATSSKGSSANSVTLASPIRRLSSESLCRGRIWVMEKKGGGGGGDGSHG